MDQLSEATEAIPPNSDGTGGATWRLRVWQLAVVAVGVIVLLIALVAAFGRGGSMPAGPADTSLDARELQVERQIGCPI